MSKDTIYREDAILAMANALWHYPNDCYKNLNVYEFAKALAELGLRSLPPAQPEITLESAIDYLHSIGWMQDHDKQMYEMGLREQLADDSDSYDALLPSALPEIIRCKYCMYSKHWYKDKRRCFLWHEEGIDVFEDGYCNYAKRRMRGEQDE